MSLRNIIPGHLYILSNDFEENEMVTITKSIMPPDQYIKLLNDEEKSNKWIISKPSRVLFHKYLENCSLVESRAHEFLVQNGFCGGAPKDYQVSLESAVFLLESIIYEKNLKSSYLLEKIKHTNVFPEEGCNYHLLGQIFNGTYGKAKAEINSYQIDPIVAFYCFKRGAGLGDEKCFPELAFCYEHGIGRPIDLGFAVEYYRQTFALNPIKGVNGLFRVFLKSGEVLKAAGIVENFINYCDLHSLESFNVDSDSSEDHIVQRVLDGHRDFVRALSGVLIDCLRFHGDWDILSGYRDVFEEFSFSLKGHFEKELRFLNESKFFDIAQDIEDCIQRFDHFIDSDLDKTGT